MARHTCAGLPPRQQEACLLFAEGRALTDVAARLNISRHTAIDHIRKIYERLDMEPDRESLRNCLLGSMGVQASADPVKNVKTD